MSLYSVFRRYAAWFEAQRAAWIRMEECQDLVPIEHSEIIDRPEDDGRRNDKRAGACRSHHAMVVNVAEKLE
jgi:hypothetical protein